MSEENVVPAVSIEEAEKVIKEEQEKKRKLCAEEIDAILTKYGFELQIMSSLNFKPKT